jgi:hypothetical protein
MSPPPSASGPRDHSVPRPSPSLTARSRIVGGALIAGLGIGGLGVATGAVTAGVEPAADAGFVLGTLAFGFGLLGWAGSVIAGPGLEAMHVHLDLRGSGWSEADSRRAMARIGGFGAGVMLSAVLVGTALGYA